MTQLGRNWEREKLPNGQTKLTIYQKPIAYRKQGVWTRITNALGNTGDPAYPIGVDELVQFRVKAKLTGQASLIHFGKGQTHIRITPLDTNNVNGVVDGQSITFAEAWNNADYKLTIAGHRLQKDIILRAGHPAQFQFRIDEHVGLDLETLETADFRILQPMLRGLTAADSVPLTWVATQQGGKTILTVTLPAGDWAGWVLDPTLTLQPDATDGKDSFLADYGPDDNKGTQTDVRVGDRIISGNSALRSVLKFNLSSIPSEATVTLVTLSLYEHNASDTSGVGMWATNLHRLLEDWVEAEVTWNSYSTGNGWATAGADSDGNDRDADISATVTLDGDDADDFVHWTGSTLTDDVQKIVDGTYANNYGWLLEAPTAESTGASYSFNDFYSSDHTTAVERPKLVVVYYQQYTKQVSLDAYLVNRLTEQVSLDALVKGTFTEQVAVDSYLTKETGYKVIIYDSSGNALARVGDHQNLRVRQRVNKTYQLEFDLHRDSENYQHLAIDNLIQVRRNEVAIFAGIIKKPGPKFGEDGKATRYVHIFAPSFEIRQDGRRVLPPSGTDYMEVTDYVDDAMKYMVRYNAVTGYVTDAKRVLTDLSVEDDTTEHPSSKKLAGKLSGGSLLEHLMRWGDAYSVDFWVDADIEAGTYVFRTKYPQRGLDRTVGNEAGRPHTIFSVGRGNVLDLDYWEDGLDACSLVYVGGPGEGETQTIRKVYSGAEPEGNARREHFIGAADTDYDDELEAAGQAYLATWGDPIKGVRFKLQETLSCKYGKDFRLGTLVTVYDADYGISLDRKIEEIEFALGEDGIEEIFLTVGSPQPTQWEMWQARMGPYESFSQTSDGRAPDEPTDLTTYSRSKAVHLTWTNPTQRDLKHIEVWRNSSASWDGASQIAEEDGTGYTDPIGLWDSTFYYALKAVDHVGNTSDGTAWVVGNTDITPPAAPTELDSSSGVVVDADGHIIPYIDCTWTDSVTEDVQSHEVEVEYYIGGAWQDPEVHPREGSPLRISPAPGNVNYRVRVRALDDANLRSLPTDDDTGTTAKDNVAPATPAGLTVTAALKAIRITVNKPGEGDWAGTEYHVSTSSGFTPGAGTLKASGRFTSHTYETTSYVVHYVRVRHYDSSGNYSGYCAQGSATPDKIDPPDDIPDDSIPDDKIVEIDWAKITNVEIVNADIVNLAADKITGQVVNAQILSVVWGKITNVAIESADIVSLVCSKLTAGSITATINITTMGTLTFASSGGTYLQGATTFLKCFGDFATASPDDISAGSILLDSSATKIYAGGSVLGADLVAGDDIFVSIGNAYCLNAGGTAYIYLTGSIIRLGGAGFDVLVLGDFDVDGVKDCVMPTTQGRVRLATVESPEVLFMDRVLGAKHGGMITGQLDPLFAEVVEPGDAWLIPAYAARVADGGFEAETGEGLFWLVARRKGKAGIRFAEAPPSGERENLPGAPVAVELQSLSLGPARLKVAACLCDADNILLRGTAKVTVIDDVPRILRDALSELGALLRQYSEGLADAEMIQLDITGKGLWHTWAQSITGNRGQRKVHTRILTRFAELNAEVMESLGYLIKTGLQVVGYEEEWNGREPSP